MNCREDGCNRNAIGVTVPYCDFHAYAREKGEQTAVKHLADTPAGDTVKRVLDKQAAKAQANG